MALSSWIRLLDALGHADAERHRRSFRAFVRLIVLFRLRQNLAVLALDEVNSPDLLEEWRHMRRVAGHMRRVAENGERR